MRLFKKLKITYLFCEIQVKLIDFFFLYFLIETWMRGLSLKDLTKWYLKFFNLNLNSPFLSLFLFYF